MNDLQTITRPSARGDEWDEGYTLALSVDKSTLYLSARDREGDTVESLPLLPRQAKRLADALLQHLDSIERN